VSSVAVFGFLVVLVYYPHMASVIEKRRADGRVYYYLVESARVDGKPRIVSQQYLGSAAEVAAKLAGAPAGSPVRSQHKAFGDLAAVWGMLERLGVAEVVDAVVPRRGDAGATVGTYLALACANRVVAPCSKLGFADWWSTTAGPRWVKVPAAALDHRRFWEAMSLLDEGDLATIEAELGRRIVTEFDLDLSGLILDMTNFATHIDSGNDKAPIAQRGKAKQKRVNLRLVGLGLIVTRDGSVPLLSHAYPGDRPDVTQFPHLLKELLTRYRQLTDDITDLTLVYDAGQNSATNHEQVEASGIGFVGSLPPSDHPDVLVIPRTRYRKVDARAFPGLTFVDTTVTALGVTRRAVLTHSTTLHTAVMVAPADVDKVVEARMRRRALLERADPPRVHLVLGEAALHRQVGGPKVLAEQLDYLATVARLPHVTMQVLPFSSGEHAALGLGFTLLTLDIGGRTQWVYLEDLTRADCLPDANHVLAYRMTFDSLAINALGERETIATLEQSRDALAGG
jgi:hypothetical protein